MREPSRGRSRESCVGEFVSRSRGVKVHSGLGDQSQLERAPRAERNGCVVCASRVLQVICLRVYKSRACIYRTITCACGSVCVRNIRKNYVWLNWKIPLQQSLNLNPFDYNFRRIIHTITCVRSAATGQQNHSPCSGYCGGRERQTSSIPSTITTRQSPVQTTITTQVCVCGVPVSYVCAPLKTERIKAQRRCARARLCKRAVYLRSQRLRCGGVHKLIVKCVCEGVCHTLHPHMIHASKAA